MYHSCVPGTALRPLHTWSYLILRTAYDISAPELIIEEKKTKMIKKSVPWLIQHQPGTKFTSYNF